MTLRVAVEARLCVPAADAVFGPLCRVGAADTAAGLAEAMRKAGATIIAADGGAAEVLWARGAVKGSKRLAGALAIPCLAQPGKGRSKLAAAASVGDDAINAVALPAAEVAAAPAKWLLGKKHPDYARVAADTLLAIIPDAVDVAGPAHHPVRALAVFASGETFLVTLQAPRPPPTPPTRPTVAMPACAEACRVTEVLRAALATDGGPPWDPSQVSLVLRAGTLAALVPDRSAGREWLLLGDLRAAPTRAASWGAAAVPGPTRRGLALCVTGPGTVVVTSAAVAPPRGPAVAAAVRPALVTLRPLQQHAPPTDRPELRALRTDVGVAQVRMGTITFQWTHYESDAFDHRAAPTSVLDAGLSPCGRLLAVVLSEQVGPRTGLTLLQCLLPPAAVLAAPPQAPPPLLPACARLPLAVVAERPIIAFLGTGLATTVLVFSADDVVATGMLDVAPLATHIDGHGGLALPAPSTLPTSAEGRPLEVRPLMPSRGLERVMLLRGNAAVMVAFAATPRMGPHAAFVRAVVPQAIAQGPGLAAMVAGLFAAAPHLAQIVAACALPADGGDVRKAADRWVATSARGDGPDFADTVAAPDFYFQFIFGRAAATETCARETVVAAIGEVRRFVDGAAGACQPALAWLLVRQLRRSLERSYPASERLRAALDGLFVFALRYLCDPSAAALEMQLAAEAEVAAHYHGEERGLLALILGNTAPAPALEPLVSGDAHSVLRFLAARCADGAVPAADVIAGTADASALGPLIRPQTLRDGAVVVDAAPGCGAALRVFSVLLVASLHKAAVIVVRDGAAITCLAGHSAGSSGCGGCAPAVVVPPQFVAPGAGPQCAVVAVDGLAASARGPAAAGMAHLALFQALVDRRPAAVRALAHYFRDIGDRAKAFLAGLAKDPLPPPGVAVTLAAAVGDAVAGSAAFGWAHVNTIAQYALAATPAEAVGLLLDLARSDTEAAAAAGAVAAWCHGLGSALSDTFEHARQSAAQTDVAVQPLPAAASMILALVADADVVPPTVASAVAVCGIHHYTEYVIGAAQNTAAAAQHRHLARDEPTVRRWVLEENQHATALDAALWRAQTVFGLLLPVATAVLGSAACRTPDDARATLYAPAVRAAVCRVIRRSSDETAAVAAAGQDQRPSPSTDSTPAATLALDFHVLQSATTLAARVSAVRVLVAGCAKAAVQDGALVDVERALRGAVRAVFAAAAVACACGGGGAVPPDEGLALILAAAEVLLFAAERVAAGQTARAFVATAAVVVLQRVLKAVAVADKTTAVHLLRRSCDVDSRATAITGLGAAPAEAQEHPEQDKYAAYGSGPFVPGQDTRASHEPGSGDAATPTPPAERPEVTTAAATWLAEADELLAVLGLAADDSLTVPAAIMGRGATHAALRSPLTALTAWALPWRADHSPPSRRFLVSCDWWSHVGALDATAAAADVVVPLLPAALRAALPTPDRVAVLCGRGHWDAPHTAALPPPRQPACLQQGLFAAVAVGQPVLQAAPVPNADAVTDTAYAVPSAAVAATPLPRDHPSQWQSPTVVVSPSTPSVGLSPQDFLRTSTDSGTVRQLLPRLDATARPMDVPRPLESALYNAADVAWWESVPPEGDRREPSGTTVTTVDDEGRRADAAQTTKALLLGVFEELGLGRQKHKCRHRAHRSRGLGASPPDATGIAPLVMERAGAAEALLPPTAGAVGGEAPLVLIGMRGTDSRPRMGAPPAIRLVDVGVDGLAVPLAAAPLPPPAHAPSPYLAMPPPALFPPPPAVTTVFAWPATNTYDVPHVTSRPANVIADPTGLVHETVFLRLPPPPAGFLPVAPPGLPLSPGADDEGERDRPPSEGRVIVNIDDALRREKEIKKKAKKKSRAASKDGLQPAPQPTAPVIPIAPPVAASPIVTASPVAPVAGAPAAVCEPAAPPCAPAPVGPNMSEGTSAPSAPTQQAPPAMPPPQAQTPTMSASEGALFRRYVEQLMAGQAVPPPQPPAGALVPDAAMPKAAADQTNRGAETHEAFMQRLLEQQQSLFALHQGTLERNQSENTKLLTDLLTERLRPRPSMFTAADGAGGLGAVQQSELLRQTMDQRDKLMRMSDDIVRLQTQNAALRSAPPPPPQIVHVLTPSAAPSAAATSVLPAPPATCTATTATQHAVLNADAYINTDSPAPRVAVSAGVQAALSPERRPLPPAVSAPPVPASERRDGAARELTAFNDQLAAVEGRAGAMEAALQASMESLGRHRAVVDASHAAAEQEAAIDALRRRSLEAAAQLTFLSRAPFAETAPHATPAPPAAAWAATPAQPPPAKDHPFDASQYPAQSHPVQASPASAPVASSPRHSLPEAAATPVREAPRSVRASFSSPPAQPAVTPAAPRVALPAAPASATVSPRRVSMAADRAPEPVMEGRWEVLGAPTGRGPALPAPREWVDVSVRPAQAPRLGSVMDMGALIADAKKAARAQHAPKRVASRSPAATTGRASSRPKHPSPAADPRFAMYAAPTARAHWPTAPAHAPALSPHHARTDTSEAHVPEPTPADCSGTGWELRERRQHHLNIPDAFSSKQRAMLHTHTGLRLETLGALLT